MSSISKKFRTLTRRAEYLKELIAKSQDYNGKDYDRGELAALEWAIPILEQHIYNKSIE